jgi:nitroimidazol reductase NimA-like FMN-containing flavoprotein (pyridoxamine 5'-phosphate oxidase superfamily)
MIGPPWIDGFLHDRRVGVLAIPRDGRPSLSTPVWYDWDGRRLRLQVEATSTKAKLLERAGGGLRVGFTVQAEAPPYRYAVLYGPATLQPNEPGLRRRIARRYFGRVAGDMYVQQEDAAGRDESKLRIVEIVPDRVSAHDFGPEAGRFARVYFALWRLVHPVRA